MLELWLHRENLSKHSVRADEVEDIILDKCGWTDQTRSGIFVKVGKTASGRFLELAYRKLSEDSFFVFHAMDARDHQKKRYKRLNK